MRPLLNAQLNQWVVQLATVAISLVALGIPITNADPDNTPEIPVVGEWSVSFRNQWSTEHSRQSFEGSGKFKIRDAGVLLPNPIEGTGTFKGTSWRASLKDHITGFWRIEDVDCPESTITETAAVEISGSVHEGRLRLKARHPDGKIKKKVNFPCEVTVTEPGIPIDTEVVTTGQRDHFNTLELDGFSIDQLFQVGTVTQSGDNQERSVTLTKLWGCMEEPPQAEVTLYPDELVNAQHQIALGRHDLELLLINLVDRDCLDEAPVDDRVNTSKTDWQIVGVDAKTVNDEVVAPWHASAEGTTEFRAMIDDWARHVDDDPSAAKPLTLTVVRPNGETNTVAQWLPDTFVHWQTRLLPDTVNFAGIKVIERDAGNSEDGCWYEGSPYPKVKLDGHMFEVGMDNIYTDINGVFDYVIEHYRDEGRVPCTIRLHQAMDVVVPGGSNVNYAETWIKYTIGVEKISVSRHGVPDERTWP